MMTKKKTGGAASLKMILALPLAFALVLMFSCKGNADSSKSEPVAEKAAETPQEVFTVVEQQPQPRGGMPGFYQYIAEHMNYPKQARQMGIEGKVFVEFIVDENGYLTQVKAIKGIGAGCDAEAVRVLQNASRWKPGLQRGIPVKVRMVIPITFALED